jgi:hypothetical protein
MASDAGKLYKSVDDGETFSNVLSGTQVPSYTYFDYFLVVMNTLYCSASNGNIFSSSDGTTFSPVSHTGLPQYFGITCLANNSTTLYAGLAAQGVYKQPISGVVSIHPGIVRYSDNISCFKPHYRIHKKTISFDNVGSDRAVLTIYSLNGSICKQVHSINGLLFADCSALSAAHYIAHIATDRHSSCINVFFEK